jgi:hypothetical protein
MVVSEEKFTSLFPPLNAVHKSFSSQKQRTPGWYMNSGVCSSVKLDFMLLKVLHFTT